ncbi:MAG: cytochrome C oxidase subunit II [Bdellovibrionales bacterium RIFOXYD12_FULL_39_22]|nr:MAG: cytochrome C oxidase subunit II [Bdellovibrionales bacterium RIFOXYB1_FULL_39_21]OFZ43826.1 MAG: cytochrome C oxidase subunit II [Bdellovibrionales bacterium RIFOXYC12_FULL_39_17]OFZ48840.1 MAG: cytochrome C oxidase subunit II [Bdellovibrionales bacterium RIFOXYC1_FULL_39_130]OFZ76573.1 MAG: cytochrome C oxidase subunit II [Bdellovibrionales bacterium RIFOXYD1_FULL_39_84]OFZ94807.1 MAG: cytochrome C oxidase subunit II [Bdellovibrionales bacterium RIFOXYD12_FULL_39_22]HLE12231.1 cytochr
MVDVDLSQVNWSRAQFALTAMYHWIFVPLTLGLSFLIAFFESIYLRTGNEEWKNITKFWMALFGVNFAIGIATGIILEFEFGTNWSNYSWMVGDIFGAPLAAEGIFAFFIEATFFAVMFFGWDRVSKRFHLFSTWMVAIGSNLSALWILVANGWMQFPIGMKFNPDSARFEMENFWEVLFSPMAISKFTHTTSSSFVLASLFVIGISAWYLLKSRHVLLAQRSIMVAAIFGLLASLYVAFTGDESAYLVAQKQPMKLAVMEGLFDGQTRAPLVAAGIINGDKQPGDGQDPFWFEVKIPGALSLLSNRDINSFVPGINDLVFGNSVQNIVGVQERMEKGKMAIELLRNYKEAKKTGNESVANSSKDAFYEVQDSLGYGYLKNPAEAVPPIAITFYSFHLMVVLGSFFPLFFALILFFDVKKNKHYPSWLLKLAVLSVPLGYVASQAGWVLAEVGRQPWAIQGLLPVSVATSNVSTTAVQTTFFIFLFLFTLLLVAEIKIMATQINNGPEEK